MFSDKQYAKAGKKDPSNARIAETIKELEKVMDKEDRGFIFCPVVQMKGRHYTLLATKFKSFDEFWATMLMIVEETNKQIPEEMREENKRGFMTFVEACINTSFPSLKLFKM